MAHFYYCHSFVWSFGNNWQAQSFCIHCSGCCYNNLSILFSLTMRITKQQQHTHKTNSLDLRIDESTIGKHNHYVCERSIYLNEIVVTVWWYMMNTWYRHPIVYRFHHLRKHLQMRGWNQVNRHRSIESHLQIYLFCYTSFSTPYSVRALTGPHNSQCQHFFAFCMHWIRIWGDSAMIRYRSVFA